MVEQEPQPPALAYVAMERLLGPRFFRRPAEGEHIARIVVIGPDRIRTVWDVPACHLKHIDIGLSLMCPGVVGQVVSIT